METLINSMPQLRMICWNRQTGMTVTDVDALALYERNWSMVNVSQMIPEEKAYLDRLINTIGRGLLMAG